MDPSSLSAGLKSHEIRQNPRKSISSPLNVLQVCPEISRVIDLVLEELQPARSVTKTFEEGETVSGEKEVTYDASHFIINKVRGLVDIVALHQEVIV